MSGPTFDEGGVPTLFATWDDWWAALWDYYRKTPKPSTEKLYRDILGKHPVADLEHVTRVLITQPNSPLTAPPAIHEYVTHLRRLAEERRAVKMAQATKPEEFVDDPQYLAERTLIRLYYRALEPPGLREPLSNAHGPAWLVQLAKWGKQQHDAIARLASNQMERDQAVADGWIQVKELFRQEWPNHEGDEHGSEG